jgi:inosine/xanthosine triphosphate pyrophosphatase family protein
MKKFQKQHQIEGNAILKANYVTKKYGYDCLADDTGLEVLALDGAPGVYSQIQVNNVILKTI